MPVYTYICNKCKKEFELLLGINQERQSLVCPQCNSRDIKRTFSSFLISGSSKGTSSCSSCSSSSCSTCQTT